jgi:hypothetical protein
MRAEIFHPSIQLSRQGLGELIHTDPFFETLQSNCGDEGAPRELRLGAGFKGMGRQNLGKALFFSNSNMVNGAVVDGGCLLDLC